MKKLALLMLIPMTLTLQGAFVMKKGQPLEKLEGTVKETQTVAPTQTSTNDTISKPTQTPTQAPTQTASSSAGKKIYEINFNKHSTGTYTMNMYRNDFTQYNGEKLNSTYGVSGPDATLSIVEDNNEKVLRVRYKKNTIATGKYPDKSTYSGFQATVDIPKNNRPKEDIYNPQEVTLEYYLKFENNFQWVIGGKLPGLAGGEVPNGGEYIGKGRLANGFSARFMWHIINGKPGMIQYLYHPGRAGAYGEKVYGTGPLLSKSNPAKELNTRDHNTMMVLQKNKWYKIKQTIKANTPKKANGTMKIWIDDALTASIGGLKYIADGKHGTYSVDKMFFSTFYGGGSMDYAPNRDTYTRFKNIRIYVK